MQTTHFVLQLQVLMYLNNYSGLAKYDQEIYDQVMDLFDNLPLSAIINNKFLCIHGGISTDIASVITFSFRSLTLKRSIESRKFQNLVYFVILFGLIPSITILASLTDSQRIMTPEDAPTTLDMN